MKKLLTAAAILVASTTLAQANQWYVVNARNAICEDDNLTPQNMRDYVRSQNHSEHTDVYRFLDGSVRAVEVQDLTARVTYEFFTLWQECQTALAIWKQAGMLTDPSELQ
jgi:hypothetical protein